jgi:Nif-specific regulatory protein
METINREQSLELVAEISRIMLEEDQLVDSIHKVLREINRIFDYPRSMITIHNRKTGKITIKEACGVSAQEKEKGVYTPGEGIIGRVVETGEAIMVEDIARDPRFLNRTGFLDAGRESHSFLCAPIKAAQEVIGALSVFTPRIDPEDMEEQLELLMIAGSILFHAVQHSRAREEELQELREENLRLHERLGDRPGRRMVMGNSKVMQRLNQMIEKISATDATVLILGESGTGKGVVAQAIHEGSYRKSRPFVKLNCAALSESIIESEMFGHERGAFTGALNQRKGRFEQAEGGTLFLDEIGEIGNNIQVKLLRVLQEKEYERVGGNETLRTDCRIIAATNKDLEQKVKTGEFREDLYYRLNVIPMTVPPLRERRSDIILLADHFIERFNRPNGKKVNRISTPAIDMLMSYHWPGNVRELENAIERAVILSEDDTIHGYHLPPSLQIAEPHVSESSGDGTLQQRLGALEYEMIIEALKATRGNMSRAARMLGLTNRMMGIRAEKYGIDFRIYRAGGRDSDDDPDS